MELSLKQKSNMYAETADFIRTFTGRNVIPTALKLEDLCINDIAHALSNQCRFGGHTKNFYSVAQHSVYVADVMFDRYGASAALSGLLHDASEAYMVDLPTPIKVLMPAYSAAEYRIQALIEKKFELTVSLNSPEVREIDRVLLATEARDLIGDPRDWPSLHGVEILPHKIFPIDAVDAEFLFLGRYELLIRRIADERK